MSSNDDFFGGMKTTLDREKEWADSAQYWVEIHRRGTEAPAEEPVVETTEKTASGAAMAGKVLQRLDPTGLAKAMSTRDGLVAGLAGGALFGIGTALSSRGKKELGGESQLERTLKQDQAARANKPEPPSFMGKMKNHLLDLSTGVASTARKHPLAAGAVGALGGAKAGTKILSLLTRKAT